MATLEEILGRKPQVAPQSGGRLAAILGGAETLREPAGEPHGAFVRGLVTSLASGNPENLGNALEAASIATGSADLANWSAKLKEVASELAPEFKLQTEGVESFAERPFGTIGELAGSAVGSTIPSIISGGVGALLGSTAGPAGTTVGAIAGATVPSFALNYGELYGALVREGLDKERAVKVALVGAGPISALDVITPAGIVSKLAGPARSAAIQGIAKRLVMETLRGARTEGLTEAAQQAIQETLVASETSAEFSLANIATAGLGGALGGGILRGPTGLVGGPSDRGTGIPTADLESLFSEGEGITLPPPPPQEPLILGPESEMPREQFQSSTDMGRAAVSVAQTRTQEFFDRGRRAQGATTAPGTPPAAPPGNVAPPTGIVATVRDSVAPVHKSIAEQLATLPQATKLRVGAEGVTGTARAVGLARQAALSFAKAKQAKLEGREDESVAGRQKAAKLLAKATEVGFVYTPAVEQVVQGAVKDAMTGVARSVTPFETPTPTNAIEFGSQQLRGQMMVTPQHPSTKETRASQIQPQAFEQGVAASQQNLELDTNPYLPAEADIFEGRAWAWEVGWTYGRRFGNAREMVTPEAQRPAGPSPLRQDPTFFNNPLEMLSAGVGRALRQVGPNLWVTAGKVPAGAIDFVRAIRSRMLPNLKLVIDVRPDSPFGGRGSHGRYFGFRGDYGLIWLGQEALGNEPTLTAVLTHELSHAIVHQHFGRAGSDTQAALYAAFRRHWIKVRGPYATAETFMDDLHSPFTLAAMKEIYSAELNREALDFHTNSHYPDWWSFDEWLAEEGSKWMYTSRKPATLLDRFFSSLGRALEFVFRKLGKTREDFLPAKEVQAWLDGLIDRRSSTGEMPLSVPGSLDAYVKGVKDNAKALGEPPGPGVPPPQAENMLLRGSELRIGRRSAAQADKWSWMSKVGAHLLQIAANNPHIGGLRNYVEATRAWNQTKMGMISRAVERLQDWRSLGKEMGRNLGEFMYALDAMEYLPVGQNARWPTSAELVAMAQKYKLNRRAVQTYMNLRADFLDVLVRIEAAAIKHAQQTITNPVALADTIAQVQSEMGAMKSRPYFPHTRFGDWTVTVRDTAGKVIYHAQRESLRAAEAHGREAVAAFPDMDVSTGKLPADIRMFQGLPPTLLKAIQNRLNLTASQQKALEGLIFDLSPQNAAVKHFKRRKGTPGFSLDAQRSFADYFQHIAGHIARLETSVDLQNAIDEVESSAQAMRGFAARDAAKRQGITDWMKEHYKYIMNPANELQALKSAIFHWHLGFNVSSAAVNLTQLPLVTYPYLAARYGDVKAIAALQKATLDLRKMFKLDPKALAQDEIDAIKLGVDQLFLEEGLAVELAGYAQMGVLDRFLPGTALQRGLLAIPKASGFLFQMVERINRRTSFLATYRIARTNSGSAHVQEVIAANPKQYNELLGKGWTPANAGAFLAARDAVDKTQFEYAAYARPEALRGKKGALFAFWMFKQNYLWFLKNDPGAKRALVVLLAMAGMIGLPFADDLSALAKAIAAWGFGKDFDPELEARKQMAELVGKEEADVLLHGLARDSFGLSWAADATGVPLPSVDMSNRIGLGNVVPGAQAALDPTSSFGDRVANVTQQIAGAGFGVPFTMLKALEANDPDVFKQYERLLPAAARNLSKAVRFAQEGETLRSGAKLVEFDVADSKAKAEAFAQALGFAPTRVSRAWDAYIAQQEAVAYWATRRGVLLDAFAYARRTKDREALADVKEAIRGFNFEAPDGRMRITADTLRRSLKARARRRVEQEAGGTGQRMYEGVGREVRGAFPVP